MSHVCSIKLLCSMYRVDNSLVNLSDVSSTAPGGGFRYVDGSTVPEYQHSLPRAPHRAFSWDGNLLVMGEHHYGFGSSSGGCWANRGGLGRYL